MAKVDGWSELPLTFPQLTDEELQEEMMDLIHKYRDTPSRDMDPNESHRLNLIQIALKRRAELRDEEQVRRLQAAAEARNLR